LQEFNKPFSINILFCVMTLFCAVMYSKPEINP